MYLTFLLVPTRSQISRSNQHGHNTADNGHECHDDNDLVDDPVVIGNHGNRKRNSSTRINWKTNAGESRDFNTLVEVQLNKVSNINRSL